VQPQQQHAVIVDIEELPLMLTRRMRRYMTKAKECDRLAQEAPDAPTKQEYLDLARKWREHAEDVRGRAADEQHRQRATQTLRDVARRSEGMKELVAETNDLLERIRALKL
jgi:hypothetical protein